MYWEIATKLVFANGKHSIENCITVIHCWRLIFRSYAAYVKQNVHSVVHACVIRQICTSKYIVGICSASAIQMNTLMLLCNLWGKIQLKQHQMTDHIYTYIIYCIIEISFSSTEIHTEIQSEKKNMKMRIDC